MHRHLSAALLLALVTGAPLRATAGPLVVDRIVAVVDRSPILLSELRERLRPFKLKLRQMNLPDAQRVAAEADVERELLQKLVDERLIAAEAKRRSISVTEDDITLGEKNIAEANHTTVPALLAEVLRNGVTESAYREEVGRQMLEGKLLLAARREHPPSAAKEGAPRHDSTLEERTAAVEKARKDLIASLREHAFVEVRP